MEAVIELKRLAKDRQIRSAAIKPAKHTIYLYCMTMIAYVHMKSEVKLLHQLKLQVAQLSQRNRAAAWVSFGWP